MIKIFLCTFKKKSNLDMMYCKFKTCLYKFLFLYFSAELSKIGVINQQRHPTQILTSLHRSPNWVITIEETNFIKELCQLELDTSKSLPVPTSIMYMILNAAKTGTAIPVEVAVQGYSICMQRVIKYASSMEFFNRYSQFFQSYLCRNLWKNWVGIYVGNSIGICVGFRGF